MTDHKDLIERLRLGEGSSADHKLLLEAADALEEAEQAERVEPVQPIAWRFRDPKDGHWLYTTHIVDLSKKYWRLKNEVFEPLFATPPAAAVSEPLTEEEILEIEEMQCHAYGTNISSSTLSVVRFARAIEAAHNIRSK